MSCDVATLKLDLDACRTAILAQDWDSAQLYLTAATATLAAIPDGAIGQSSANWSRTLTDLRALIREGKTAATIALTGTIQRQDIEYANPSG